MTKSVTPGRLALCAVALLVGWIIVATIWSSADDASVSSARDVVGAIVFVIAGVLLVVAAIAKAVQIGVRTGRD